MFEHILNKHVTVFRKDGNVLMGFLLEVKDGFVRMVEQDNKVIIFTIDGVDLIREGITDFSEKVVEKQVALPQARKVSRKEQTEYEFLDDENPNYDEKCVSSCPGEFSMSINRTEEDSKYSAPSFLRTTERE